MPRTRWTLPAQSWAIFTGCQKDHALSPFITPSTEMSLVQKDHFISENLPMWSDVGPTNIGLVTACPAENQMEPNPRV